MGYIDTCTRCRGSGESYYYDDSFKMVTETCRKCGGGGKVKPYRVRIGLTEGAKLGWNDMPSWPRFGREGFCQVCDTALKGRQTAFCSRSCNISHGQRLYAGVHWQKRAIAVRDGCACRSCGLVYESPLRDGGPVYPSPHMLELDHIHPLHLGGDESPANCQLLCSECHQRKTDKDRRLNRGRIGAGAKVEAKQ